MVVEQTPHAGPGLWIRIQHRFGPRLPEWMLATIAAGWGAIMLLPADTFSLPSYAGFRQLFGSELALGLTMLFVGLACIVGLIINGARKHAQCPRPRRHHWRLGHLLSGVRSGGAHQHLSRCPRRRREQCRSLTCLGCQFGRKS